MSEYEKQVEIYQRIKKENPCIFCVQYDDGCQLKGHSCNSTYLRMYYERDYSEIEPFLKNTYIKELEKENEELEVQLTKSKKYIRKLLDWIKSKENGDGRIPTPYFYEEYEKFLKEIEE